MNSNSDVCRRYVGQRELGLHRGRFGPRDDIYRQLYASFDDNASLEERHFIYSDYLGSPQCPSIGPTGAIFNLAFSPDGAILGAASERKSVLLFDPSTRKLMNSVENAHSDSVNCIRFLDTRVFATCSDDTNVALWDARYLKSRLRTLSGHSNWVKNIEFSYRENCLITSGFDGAIYLWDINRYSEREGLECTKAFYNNGLMRMKLTPDGTKMVISTTNAYIMIIHDLCLETLAKDLQNFKPNVYRIMQISGEPMPSAFNFTHLFHAKRNRVEFISDFAPSNDAEVISSLQLHPQGWVAVSRNVSSDEQSEWCCVHDIQSYPTSQDKDTIFDERRTSSPSTSTSSTSTPAPPDPPPPSSNSSTGFARLAAFIQATSSLQDVHNRATRNAAQREEQRDQATPNTDNARTTRRSLQRPEQRAPPDPDSENVRAAIVAADFANVMQLFQNFAAQSRRSRPNERSQAAAALAAHFRAEQQDDTDSDETDGAVQGFLLITPGLAQGARARVIHLGNRPRTNTSRSSEVPKDARLHPNTQRLTHYIEESNHCRGYIKEMSFSPDGRVLASPFAHGIRLLAFDEQVRELSDCPPSYPSESAKPLHEVALLTKCHNDAVLATAFSPHHFTMVSGCMAGKIVWHQPMM